MRPSIPEQLRIQRVDPAGTHPQSPCVPVMRSSDKADRVAMARCKMLWLMCYFLV